MKNKILFLTSIFLSSCMATQKDMIVLQSQIDDLNSNIYTLKKNQADLSLKIDELNKNLTVFSENTKDLSTGISNLSLKIDNYTETTDKKINQIGKAVTEKQNTNTENEYTIFYKGINAYSSKRFNDAVEIFGEYIKKYPKADNIDMAYYYIANSLYDIKNYKDASIFYAKIMVNYPQFKEMPQVRLKYAVSLINLNDKTKIDEAITYLKSIEKDFPKEIEAKNAKLILLELTQKTKNKPHKR